MKIFIIGTSNSGKTPFAKRVAEALTLPHVGASEWFRAHLPLEAEEDRQAFADAITGFSTAVLARDPDTNVRYLRETYDLEAGCVIEGVRNPRDFVHLFDPRTDIAVFLTCAETSIIPTAFEAGIGVIKAYLAYLGDSGLMENAGGRMRTYRFARFQPIQNAPVPESGWHADLDAAITDFLATLPKPASRTPCPPASTVHAEIPPFRCMLREEYLHDMDPSKVGGLVPITVFAVSSYVGSVPTFQVLLANGSVFSFLPPEALIDPQRAGTGTKLGAKDLSYRNCADGMICVHAYGTLQGPVHAFFRSRNLWMDGTYVLTIDWYQENALLHLIALQNGQFAFLPSHKVKFGQASAQAFEPYKKLRHTWSV